MLWEDAVASIAPIFGTTTAECAFLFGMILSLVMGAFLALINTRTAKYGLPIGTLFGVVIFTFAQWLPFWTGTAIAFAISIMCAYIISTGLR